MAQLFIKVVGSFAKGGKINPEKLNSVSPAKTIFSKTRQEDPTVCPGVEISRALNPKDSRDKVFLKTISGNNAG
jgi:hypothetical protein